MKKVFLAFVAASIVILASCSSEPKSTEATSVTVDSAVSTVTVDTASVDTVAAK